MKSLWQIFDDWWFEATIVALAAIFFWALIELISLVVCPT